MDSFITKNAPTRKSPFSSRCPPKLIKRNEPGIFLDGVALEIRDRLFGCSATNPPEPGYFPTKKVCPPVNYLNDEQDYAFTSRLFKREMNICQSQFSIKYPGILPNHPFEWYYANISRVVFFLYHALCCAPEEQIPLIWEENIQLFGRIPSLRRSEKLSFIKDIAFSKFGDFDKIDCVLNGPFSSSFDCFLYLLPYIAYLLQKCTHSLTCILLVGLLEALFTNRRVNPPSIETVNQVVASIEHYCQIELKKDITKPTIEEMRGKLYLRSLISTDYRQKRIRAMFHRPRSSLYRHVVNQLVKAKGLEFLYLSTSSQSIPYTAGNTAIEVGEMVSVAYPDGPQQLAICPVIAFDLSSILAKLSKVKPVESTLLEKSLEKVPYTISNRIIICKETAFYSWVPIMSLIANPPTRITRKRKTHENIGQTGSKQSKKSSKATTEHEQLESMNQRMLQLEQQLSQQGQLLIAIAMGQPITMLTTEQIQPALTIEPEIDFLTAQQNYVQQPSCSTIPAISSNQLEQQSFPTTVQPNAMEPFAPYFPSTEPTLEQSEITESNNYSFILDLDGLDGFSDVPSEEYEAALESICERVFDHQNQ